MAFRTKMAFVCKIHSLLISSCPHTNRDTSGLDVVLIPPEQLQWSYCKILTRANPRSYVRHLEGTLLITGLAVDFTLTPV